MLRDSQEEARRFARPVLGRRIRDLRGGQRHGRVEAVYADENVWLSQKVMAQLYDVDVRTTNYHLKTIFTDSELEEEVVIQHAYFDVAEDMAIRKLPMTMQDWGTWLNRFLSATAREVLKDAGKVTAEIARAHAESEFEKHRIVQDRLFESDFDRVVKETKRIGEGAVSTTASPAPSRPGSKPRDGGRTLNESKPTKPRSNKR